MGDWGQTKQTFSVNIFLGTRFHSGGPGISTGCFFFTGTPLKSESMENLDTPNLAKINFLYLELLGGVPVKKIPSKMEVAPPP